MNKENLNKINATLNAAGISLNVQISFEQLTNTQESFNKMNQFANGLKTADVANLNPMHCHQEISKMSNNSSHFKNSLPMLCNKECLTQSDVDLMLKEIRQSQVSTANKIIGLSVAVAVVTVACQAYQLKKIWEVIANARDLTNESKRVVLEMGVNLETIKQDINEIQPWMKLHDETPETNERKRDSLIRKIQRKYIEVRELYDKTRNRLSELRIQIDGKLESFESFHSDKKRDLLINTAFSGAQFGSNLAQAIMFAGTVNPIMLGASIAATAGLGVVAAANLVMIALSMDTLDELRKQLKEIDQLQKDLFPLNAEIEKIKTWLEKNDVYD